ncbi:MAG: response regulator transcription factor [Verrucomicrobiota bacterium]
MNLQKSGIEMMNKKITVSLVEDDQGTREKLQAVLSNTPGLRCLNIYASGEEAVQKLPTAVPDVVLMDINLPGMSGIQCVGQLKAKLPKVQILMLTTYEDSKLIFDSLRAGASGYLLKNMPAAEVVQAVEQVSAGGSPMSMAIARKVVNHFQQIKQAPTELDLLSKREQEILALLAKGYLYKEIADQLGITPGTVRVHLHTVYEKLHVSSRTEAVVKFLGNK